MQTVTAVVCHIALAAAQVLPHSAGMHDTPGVKIRSDPLEQTACSALWVRLILQDCRGETGSMQSVICGCC
jgi:hypothetical protein